ncbi:hypothetical protein M0802_008182 [Mischocyttarus mexicanus]|nr:hypothetical protein M0802_008182 [Mischocyttarus mexicanus]
MSSRIRGLQYHALEEYLNGEVYEKLRTSRCYSIIIDPPFVNLDVEKFGFGRWFLEECVVPGRASRLMEGK